MLRRALEESSRAMWRTELAVLSGAPTHLRAQQCPASFGGKLLAAGKLEMLFAAGACDRLRASFQRMSLLVPGSSARRCVLCAGDEHGLAHLLASCSAASAARKVYLDSIGRDAQAALSVALEGDWPQSVLSPHQSVHNLSAAASLGAEIERMLTEAS